MAGNSKKKKRQQNGHWSMISFAVDKHSACEAGSKNYLCQGMHINGGSFISQKISPKFLWIKIWRCLLPNLSRILFLFSACQGGIWWIAHKSLLINLVRGVCNNSAISWASFYGGATRLVYQPQLVSRRWMWDCEKHKRARLKMFMIAPLVSAKKGNMKHK